MATGDSLAGDQVTIYIGDADDIGSAFNGTNDPTGALQYQAEVTSFNVDGGERETDSTAVFGGGYIDKTKPQAQFEITMDIILRHGTDVDRWDALWYSATGGGSITFTGKKMVAIQATDGTNYYWNAWNNVTVINVDKEFSAEDEWRGTVTFKLSAATADAITNIQYGKADVLTDLTAWT